MSGWGWWHRSVTPATEEAEASASQAHKLTGPQSEFNSSLGKILLPGRELV